MMKNQTAVSQESKSNDHRVHRERLGVVVSDKMKKTVVVEVMRLAPHQLYGKSLKIKTRYKAHDEKNSAKVGDHVRIVETRPISKEKRWRVVEVVKS